VKTVPAMITSNMCNACRKQGEDEVDAVDSGDAGTVHHRLSGCQVLLVYHDYFFALRWSVRG